MSPIHHVAVTSDELLVADTVGSALARPDLVVGLFPWPDEPGWKGLSDLRGPVDAGLVLCELQPHRHLAAATRLVRQVPIPWVVLTGAPAGPLWGAVLEAGAAGVLRRSSSLDDVRDAIARVVAGKHLHPRAEADLLVGAWWAADRRRLLAMEQVSSLTPRESAVLDHMHAGESVHHIAATFGVSESTVRSQVRAVLRKLHVRTQLAAVATYDVAVEVGEELEAER